MPVIPCDSPPTTMPNQDTATILRFPGSRVATKGDTPVERQEPFDFGQAALTGLIGLTAILQFAVVLRVFARFHH